MRPFLCEKCKSQIAVKILARASAGVDEKWVVKVKNAPILCQKCKSQKAVKILARASAGVDEKWVVKIKNDGISLFFFYFYGNLTVLKPFRCIWRIFQNEISLFFDFYENLTVFEAIGFLNESTFKINNQESVVVYISVISATLEYVSLFHESTLLHRVTSYRFYWLQVFRFFSLEFSVGSFGSVV